MWTIGKGKGDSYRGLKKRIWEEISGGEETGVGREELISSEEITSRLWDVVVVGSKMIR
jgi:hypothetical protein